jgi:uncharacterized protein (DUF58 family)
MQYGPRVLDDPTQALATVVPPDLRAVLRGRTLRLARPVGGPQPGRHHSVRAGVGDQFRGHQAYTPGDDLRRLDWRAVARRDRLVLRQTDAEDAMSAVLLLDVSGAMSYGTAPTRKQDCAAALAAALAHLALRQGDRVGFACGRDGAVDIAAVRPQAGAQRLAALAHALARAPSGACPWPALIAAVAPALPRRSLVLAFSDLLDPDPGDPDGDAALHRALATLRSRGHDIVLVQVLHRDELTFPWTGRDLWRFEDPRAVRPAIEGHGHSLRAEYLANLNAHLAHLDHACASGGIHLHRVVSDDPLPAALLSLLSRLSGRPLPEATP